MTWTIERRQPYGTAPAQLIMAAGGLSQRTDAASAEALRAVTAETQRRGFRL